MTTLEATQEIVTAGSQEVGDLATKLEGIAQEIRDVQADLDQIPLWRTYRREQREEAHAPVQTAETALIQASTRAKWAQGTLGEDEAVKAVSLAKRALGTVRKHYEQVQAETSKGDQAANAREQELRKHLAHLETEQASRQAELQGVQSAHKIAHSELGELKKTALVHGFEEKQRRVEELREELLSAQVELHDYHASALVELSDWPAQRKGLAQLRRPDDATYRVLEASLHYVDTLLADTSEVNDVVHLPTLHTPYHGYSGLWNKIVIFHNEVIDNTHKSPRLLQERRDLLQKLLDEYRAHLDEQE